MNTRSSKTYIFITLFGVAVATSTIAFAQVSQQGSNKQLRISSSELSKNRQAVDASYKGSNGLIARKKSELASIQAKNPKSGSKTRLQQEATALENTFSSQLSAGGRLSGNAKKQALCTGVTASSAGILAVKIQALQKAQAYALWQADEEYASRMLKLSQSRYSTDKQLVNQIYKNHSNYESGLSATIAAAQKKGLGSEAQAYAEQYRQAILDLDNAESKSFIAQRNDIDAVWLKYRDSKKTIIKTFYTKRIDSINQAISFCRTKPSAAQISAKYDALNTQKQQLGNTYKSDRSSLARNTTQNIKSVINKRIAERKKAEAAFATKSKALKTGRYAAVFRSNK